MILDELRKRRVGVVALCSYGRSGTTFCMQILRAAGIAVLGEFPFEQRTTQVGMLHWLQRALAAPGQDTLPPAFGRVTFRGGAYTCGTFADARSYDDVVQTEAQLAEQVAATAPPDRRWLGEKFLGFDTLRLCRTFDTGDLVQPLFLLRDPRDVFLSVRRFNERRGVRGFQDTGDDAHLLRMICLFEERQLAEHTRLGGMLTRYEDLIAPDRRDDAVRVILQHLRIPPVPDTLAAIWAQVDAGRDAAASHITGAAAVGTAPVHAKLFASQAVALARLGYAQTE